MVHGWPTLSSSTDDVFFFIMGISFTLLLLTSGTMVFFVIRYSRKRNPRAVSIKNNVALEVVWTVIPTILVLAIFWVGWKGFVYKRTVPPDAMLVKVTARQWSWSFRYGNGQETPDLKVPLGKPVKLAITSADVLHSLFIPAFRVKEDAVPGRETYLWFQPDRTGSFDLFCTEYCGVGHSDMITKVVVMPDEEFEKWYRATAAAAAPGTAGHRKLDGAQLFQVKGCIACHSTDGTPKIGPTLKGVYEHSVSVVTGGKERRIVADEEYLKTSLLDPQADVVKGFAPIMPSQKGVLTDEEIEAIIEYLETLK